MIAPISINKYLLLLSSAKSDSTIVLEWFDHSISCYKLFKLLTSAISIN